MKRITAVVLVLAFLLVSVPVFAGPVNDQTMEDDILMARPLGIASIVGGAALWVISLPFAVISGTVPKTTEALITKPIKYTFARPVGDFDYEPAPSQTEENAQ